MVATAFIRARVDEDIKQQAATVLAEMGLTVSDLMRMTLTKVAKDKAFHGELHTTNTLTAQPLAKSERGEDIHQAKDADDLFEQLGI